MSNLVLWKVLPHQRWNTPQITKTTAEIKTNQSYVTEEQGNGLYVHYV